MSLFDDVISEVIMNNNNLTSLRPVVEKEVLHHDILRIMSKHGLLNHLTFIGGTSLRLCHNSMRLSEDLDFTGGFNFNRDTLYSVKEVLIKDIQDKYNLSIEVDEPVKDKGNVDTWKVKIQTRTERKFLPAQRIHLDICSITSHDVEYKSL